MLTDEQAGSIIESVEHLVVAIREGRDNDAFIEGVGFVNYVLHLTKDGDKMKEEISKNIGFDPWEVL